MWICLRQTGPTVVSAQREGFLAFSTRYAARRSKLDGALGTDEELEPNMVLKLKDLFAQ
jgi:hypothetical protein